MLKNKSKCQISNDKTSVLVFVILILNLFCALDFAICHCAFAQDRRDPFIPLVTGDGRLLKLEAQEVSGPLELEGIIFDPAGSSYAIINSQVVKKGAQVDDFTVVNIEKNKVVLAQEEKFFELQLKEEE